MVFDRLKEAFKDYEIEIEIDSKNNTEWFIIKNPHWRENIEINYAGEYIFYFSYQHAHFDENEIEDLIEYINGFISGEMVAIEFFMGEKAAFGGGGFYAEIDMSSKESLYSYFFPNMQLPLHYKNINKCLIRGWNNTLNKDIIFDTLK
jgi:hypothetical protein